MVGSSRRVSCLFVAVGLYAGITVLFIYLLSFWFFEIVMVTCQWREKAKDEKNAKQRKLDQGVVNQPSLPSRKSTMSHVN